MTANQINYRANLEKERTNRAMETETNRHNVELERIQRSNVDVSNRVATENERHNRVMEGLQGYASSIQEKIAATTARHYELQDSISRTKMYLEDARARLTLLTNTATERQKTQSTYNIAYMNAQNALQIAELNAGVSERNSERSYEASVYGSDVSRSNTKSTNINRTINTIIGGVFDTIKRGGSGRK